MGDARAARHPDGDGRRDGQLVVLWALVYPFQQARHILEILGMYSAFSVFALVVYRVQQREVHARAKLANAYALLDSERAKSDQLLLNTASRMESHGVVDEVHVSEATQARLNGTFVLEARGEIEIKGKGPMRTFLLKGRIAGHAQLPLPSAPRRPLRATP